MKKITLVGCGNIGSRHLQGLCKLNNFEIDIVEPSMHSRKIAKQRLREINVKTKLRWHNSIEDLREGELAIIATTSENRVKIIKKLLNKKYNKFILEKVVCQSVLQYKTLLRDLEKFNATAWVNLSRRYYLDYKKIEKKFKGSDINISVISGNNDLGTNLIHYVDLFCWMNNDYKIILNGNNLFKNLCVTKRGKKFQEFAGSVYGTLSNKTFLNVSYTPFSNYSSNIFISNKTEKILVDEENGLIYDLNKKTNHKFKTQFQSELTDTMIKDVINNSVKLPKVEELFTIHEEIFRIFLKHLKKQKINTKICPIT
jgi:hypothetical protein